MMLLDHLDDGGEFIKQLPDPLRAKAAAAQVTALPIEKTSAAFPDEEFVVVRRTKEGTERYFPMSDRGNTELSLLYFAQNCWQLPKHIQKTAADRLVQRAADLEIPVTADQLLARADYQPPREVDPRHVEFRGQKLPVNLPKQASAVVGDFNTNLHQLTPVERRSVALQLVALEVDPGERLDKYAGVDESPAYNLWMNRREAVLGERMNFARTDFTAVLREPDLEKRALLLAGLDHRWGPFPQIPDAYQTVFAPRASQPVEATPTPPTYSEVMLQKVSAALGEETAEALRTGAALDNETQRLVSQLTAVR